MKSTTTGRVFVVKQTHTIRANRCTAASSYKPIPREAHLLLEVLRPHQNIVKMFGCDVFNLQIKNMYFAYCFGDDLIDQIDHFSKNKMYAPEAFVLHVCIELVQALAYLHWGLRWNDFEKSWSRDRKHIRIVHGDAKCDNVFLDWAQSSTCPGLPRVVFGDLGLAQPAETFRGIAGTETYEAPEIVKVSELRRTDPAAFDRIMGYTGFMTPATDVYSLGIVLHMVATLRTHESGADPTLTAIWRAEPESG